MRQHWCTLPLVILLSSRAVVLLQHCNVEGEQCCKDVSALLRGTSLPTIMSVTKTVQLRTLNELPTRSSPLLLVITVAWAVSSMIMSEMLLILTGCEFEVVEAPLEEPVLSHYRAAARMWNQLRREFLYAAEQASPLSSATNPGSSIFFSAQHRERNYSHVTRLFQETCQL